ncbi:hypothetical protein ACSBR2_004070 [Camellia fascicularis]
MMILKKIAQRSRETQVSIGVRRGARAAEEKRRIIEVETEKGQRLVMSQKTEREQVKIWRKIEQQLKMGEVEMIKTRIGPKIKEGRKIMIGISTKIKSVIKIKIKIVRIEGRKETVIEKPRQQRRIMSEQGRRRGQKRRAKIGIKKEIGQKTRKGKRRETKIKIEIGKGRLTMTEIEMCLRQRRERRESGRRGSQVKIKRGLEKEIRWVGNTGVKVMIGASMQQRMIL